MRSATRRLRRRPWPQRRRQRAPDQLGFAERAGSRSGQRRDRALAGERGRQDAREHRRAIRGEELRPAVHSAPGCLGPSAAHWRRHTRLRDRRDAACRSAHRGPRPDLAARALATTPARGADQAALHRPAHSGDPLARALFTTARDVPLRPPAEQHRVRDARARRLARGVSRPAVLRARHAAVAGRCAAVAWRGSGGSGDRGACGRRGRSRRAARARPRTSGRGRHRELF